jgi:hypothetical protein
MFARRVRTISLSLFALTSLSCLPLAAILLSGDESTRAAEVPFFVCWLLPLLPTALTCVPWGKVGMWLDGVERARNRVLGSWLELLKARLPARKSQGPRGGSLKENGPKQQQTFLNK